MRLLFWIKLLFFTKWEPFKNYVFVSSKSSFGSLDIQIFVFWHSPLFFPVSHCFRGRSKKNLKVCIIVNCLNNNLMTHFVWYLEKEITCDIETLSIDRETRNIFLNKSCKKWNQKLAPDPILILLNNPKQPFHARSSLKIKIFFKKNYQQALKKLTLFFLSNPVSFNG